MSDDAILIAEASILVLDVGITIGFKMSKGLVLAEGSTNNLLVKLNREANFKCNGIVEY